MPIRLPNGLPAQHELRSELVNFIGERNFAMPYGPTLQIALLNLMPCKPITETQIARLVGGTPYPVELTLFVPDGYSPKTTSGTHMASFYRRWSDIQSRHFDALIVTGAPVETLPFEDVAYWRELTEIFDWAECHTRRGYYICWAAQAALYHFYGVDKTALPKKQFGVFEHEVVDQAHPLFAGVRSPFAVPVSRHTEVRPEDLPVGADISILATSAEAGLCLLEDTPRGIVLMFNHLEYDADTLRNEYVRDVTANRPIDLPQNYFPDDDPTRMPTNRWRGTAKRVFENWLAELWDTIGEETCCIRSADGAGYEALRCEASA